MDVKSIFRALAADLDNVSGVQGKAFVPDSISVVTACVVPVDPFIEYHDTLTGGMVITVDVLVLVPKPVDFDWQEKIQDFCSTDTPASIRDAIESDSTRKCLGAAPPAITTIGTVDYGSVRFRVQILA